MIFSCKSMAAASLFRRCFLTIWWMSFACGFFRSFWVPLNACSGAARFPQISGL